MAISYSAPAKIILSGEHGVVYGKPALVVAINVRLQCTAMIKEKQSTNKLTQFIVQTTQSYLRKKRIPYKANYISLILKSNIPSNRCLGSSAALSVAAAAACLHALTDRSMDRESINNVAYLIEKKFHSNPSGADVSTSCFGGLIFYRKEFEFLKTISALNFKLPTVFEEHLYLIDSGKPKETTKEMVTFLGKKYNETPEIIEQNINKIEKVTKKMTLSIIKEDLHLFETCIAENEAILESLGLVSDSTKQLLTDLKQFGEGKITGGGGNTKGSGYLVFLTKDKMGLEKYLHKKHIGYLKFKQDSEGVKQI